MSKDLVQLGGRHGGWQRRGGEAQSLEGKGVFSDQHSASCKMLSKNISFLYETTSIVYFYRTFCSVRYPTYFVYDDIQNVYWFKISMKITTAVLRTKISFILLLNII